MFFFSYNKSNYRDFQKLQAIIKYRNISNPSKLIIFNFIHNFLHCGEIIGILF